MINSNKYLGMVFNTSGGECFIVDYKGSSNVTVMFYDNSYTCKVQMGDLRRGMVRNPYHNNFKLCGVGIRDLPANNDRSYKLWHHVINRCYNVKHHKIYGNYENCSVSEDWLTYSNFKKDVEGMKGFNEEDWHLDKDLLFNGNRIYSKETCCFLPRQINNITIKPLNNKNNFPVGVTYRKNINKYRATYSCYGKTSNLGYFNTPEEAFKAYKEAKESYARELAHRWKDQIDERAFQALMNYEVVYEK